MIDPEQMEYVEKEEVGKKTEKKKGSEGEKKALKWGAWLAEKIPGMPGRAKVKDAKVYEVKLANFRQRCRRVEKGMVLHYGEKESQEPRKFLEEAKKLSRMQAKEFRRFAEDKEKEGLPEECLTFKMEKSVMQFVRCGMEREEEMNKGKEKKISKKEGREKVKRRLF